MRKIDSDDPISFAREVVRQPMRDRHDLVFSLERVPGCDLYRAGDGLHADWLAYRQAFYPLMGRIPDTDPLEEPGIMPAGKPGLRARAEFAGSFAIPTSSPIKSSSASTFRPSGST